MTAINVPAGSRGAGAADLETKRNPAYGEERLLLERNYAKNSLVCFKCDCNSDTWRMRCQKSYSISCSKGWKSAIGELCLVIYNNEMLWSSGEETHTSNQSDNLTKETDALILFHQLPNLKAVSKNSLIPQHCHQRTPPGSVTETNKKLPFDGIPAYGCCDHQSIISKPLKSDGFFSPYSRYRWRCP